MMMKVNNRQLLRSLVNQEQAAGQAGSTEDMDGTQQQEELSAREILKKALEAMYDPKKDMTEEEHSAYQEKLMAKVKSGKKLTAKEMNYLRIHDPAAYRLARRMEYKRLKLEQRLKHCRSKEEAEEVFNQSVEGISDKDPDKEVLIQTYQEAYTEFKKTMQYKRLPATKEEAEAERLHGKRKKAFLEGKDYAETEMDQWFSLPDQGDSILGDGLIKLDDEGASPIDELLDELPVMDVVG